MANVYDWKIKGIFNANPQRTGEFIARIEEEYGAIHPKLLVEKSRSRRAPTHNCFTWDDTEAAEKFREGQARTLLKNITVKIISTTEEEKPETAFYSVKQVPGYVREDKGKVYISIAKAKEDTDYMIEILMDALKDMISFQKRYAEIEELTEILESMKNVRPILESIIEKELSA